MSPFEKNKALYAVPPSVGMIAFHALKAHTVVRIQESEPSTSLSDAIARFETNTVQNTKKALKHKKKND